MRIFAQLGFWRGALSPYPRAAQLASGRSAREANPEERLSSESLLRHPWLNSPAALSGSQVVSPFAPRCLDAGAATGEAEGVCGGFCGGSRMQIDRSHREDTSCTSYLEA